jgi:hypothetical protein
LPGTNISDIVEKNIINNGLATPAPTAAKVPNNIKYLSFLSECLNNYKKDPFF